MKETDLMDGVSSQHFDFTFQHMFVKKHHNVPYSQNNNMVFLVPITIGCVNVYESKEGRKVDR